MKFRNSEICLALCLLSYEIFVFHFCTALSTNFIISKNLRMRNFGKLLTDSFLNVSLFGSFPVKSELQCLFECVVDSRCQSFNYGRQSNAVTTHCFLSSTDRFAGRENLTRIVGFNHRGITNKCETSRTSLCGIHGFCVPVYEEDSIRCDCTPGYSGLFCNQPVSCAQILRDGRIASGVYVINPDGRQSFSVFCDMVTDGGGWTVLQRRQDGSVNFAKRGWAEYKNGFGDLQGEFWLGNEKIHRLTTSTRMTLRFDLEDFEGQTRFATYEQFAISGEDEKYKISFGAYNGTAGNSLQFHYGRYFTTLDADNDLYSGNCAVLFTGAWWYSRCHRVNINGVYRRGNTSSFGTGITWQDFRGLYYSLKRTVMMVRPA